MKYWAYKQVQILPQIELEEPIFITDDITKDDHSNKLQYYFLYLAYL